MKTITSILALLVCATGAYAYNPTIEVTPFTETNHQVSFAVSVELKSGTNWFTVVAPPEYRNHTLASFALVGGGRSVRLTSPVYEYRPLPDGKLNRVPKTQDPKVSFPVEPARFLEAKLAVRYANGLMNGITFHLDLKAYADKRRGTTKASTATNQPALRTD